MKKIIPKSNLLCEPHMSKRNLYPTLSFKNRSVQTKDIMNFLQYSDGKNDLTKIAKLININYNKALKYKNLLSQHFLINV